MVVKEDLGVVGVSEEDTEERWMVHLKGAAKRQGVDDGSSL